MKYHLPASRRGFRGQEILIHPDSPPEGVVVAFITCNGAPVEFSQFLK